MIISPSLRNPGYETSKYGIHNNCEKPDQSNTYHHNDGGTLQLNPGRPGAFLQFFPGFLNIIGEIQQMPLLPKEDEGSDANRNQDIRNSVHNFLTFGGGGGIR